MKRVRLIESGIAIIGMVMCLICCKVNHNATDPGPEVVVEADTLQFSYNIYPGVFKIYPQ